MRLYLLIKICWWILQLRAPFKILRNFLLMEAFLVCVWRGVMPLMNSPPPKKNPALFLIFRHTVYWKAFEYSKRIFLNLGYPGPLFVFIIAKLVTNLIHVLAINCASCWLGLSSCLGFSQQREGVQGRLALFCWLFTSSNSCQHDVQLMLSWLHWGWFGLQIWRTRTKSRTE